MINRRSRINEELHVAIDREVIKVGIIEFDEDYWFPFIFDPRKNFLVDAFGRDIPIDEPQAPNDKENELEDEKEHQNEKESMETPTIPEEKTTATTELHSNNNNTNQESQIPVMISLETVDMTADQI
ncbi:hypothetical protein LXL04_021469 [Taraxacum kok-saghyz]